MSKSPTLAGQREGENQPASETHPVTRPRSRKGSLLPAACAIVKRQL